MNVLSRPGMTVAPRRAMAPGRCHHYGSVLLDAGENVKALAEYLGHSDPGFTLRTYTHLLPNSQDRARKAIDQAFQERQDDAA